LINGLITLQKKVEKEQISESRWYGKQPIQDVPIPVLGPDIFDPRKVEVIREETHKPEIPETILASDEGGAA